MKNQTRRLLSEEASTVFGDPLATTVADPDQFGGRGTISDDWAFGPTAGSDCLAHRERRRK